MIIPFIVQLVVLGLAFYLIGLLPLASPFPEIIKIVAIIIGLILVLQFVGVAFPFHI